MKANTERADASFSLRFFSFGDQRQKKMPSTSMLNIEGILHSDYLTSKKCYLGPASGSGVSDGSGFCDPSISSGASSSSLLSAVTSIVL